MRGDTDDGLDRAFLALADPVRRSIIARLSRGPQTVGSLAEPFAITVQAVSRHIRVLEEAGLVTRSRDGQRRPVHLEPTALEAVTAWIDGYRLEHERRFRGLDAVLRASVAVPASRTPDSRTPASRAPASQTVDSHTKEKDA
ncbi:metalloregulator ArsR/SmtB family transcription factor [Herbiconiux sp. CPCC 205716]|uniref:Metalloregulator ArsR/SmtB family transcription factor n=1 Tax=Herbiconiux gentiana TaxID=2970912 RepID=A0ABT2GMH2_9MICO|nr:metalloregulator ArsR/SmtB family transcription factor [Herbiconiux gentiana]MCS5716475.1 metalloregulator ArsR/SmtB family transcription factor [Herbiconiux gentiana]